MRLPLLLALVACAPAPPDGTASRYPIIGGTYDPGDSAIAAVLESNGTLICTGTLVAPRALVSAAHCVILGSPRYVFFGPDPRGDGQYVDVADTFPNPTFDLDTLDGDISVISLVGDAPAFVGEPIPLIAGAPEVGMLARMVGYGYTAVGPSGDYAIKHQLDAVPIEQVDALTFRYGVATCNGDSGGPALVDEGGREVIAGVTSWGDPTCGEYGVDTRVDVFRPWVESVLADLGGPSCDPDGACVISCEPRDEDCTVVPIGDPCVSDFDCGESALCFGRVCRGRCDTSMATGCALNEQCKPVDSLVAANLGACVPSGDGACGCRAGGARPPSWLPLTGLLLLLRRRGQARYDRGRCARSRS